MALSLRAVLLTIAPLAVSFAVVLAVNLLPPDTALEETQAAGRLTVCAPREMGPLVTRDRDRPGFEIALVEEAARRSGWRATVTANIAMAREFNPANWRITRATCRMIVGGLRDNSWSRSLMELGEPYLTSSWVQVAAPGTVWPPAEVVFTPGVFALDRVALGSYLRKAGIHILPEQTPADVATAIDAGKAPVAITDSIMAAFLFRDTGLEIAPLPDGPASTGISLGFWKGDTTLRLHMDEVLDQMDKDGTIARFAEDYGIAVSLLR
ncbi:transporter substrate-binding domain-containing protein [Devosia sp. 2618]|uniref:substrate-binding periplasmic protein n=1 Tax=Devosia sp. 2618 TaxID=3156454 RepID=UPI003396919A